MALIGGITVPPNPPVGVFPLATSFGFTEIIDPPIATHLFLGAGDIKRSQRFLLGPGNRQWNFTRELDDTELATIIAFWESHNASAIPFTFNLPLADRTTTPVTAVFASQPFQQDRETGEVYSVPFTLLEVYTGAGPDYTSVATVERFPSDALNSALSDQAQQLIKLVTIRPKLSTYPPIYLSDQLVTIDGITYQPRLLKWDGIGQVAVGMPGVGSESDDVSLSFGNADRVMSLLTADVQLDLADIQLSFFHVQSRILCNFWSGIIIPGGWASNTGPEFAVKCSDKLSSPFLVAPPRNIDRRCNKMFNDGIECPFASVGVMDSANYPLGDPATCDHGLTTENGCYAHGMQLYFGGLVANPQSITTKDNSTGVFGFFRNTIVSASLISDSAYGHAIPIVVTDIPFPVNAILIAGRDEGDFYDAIAVVGEGPMSLSNLSTLDGQLNHDYPGPLGIRFIRGLDPCQEVNSSTSAVEVPNPDTSIGAPPTVTVQIQGVDQDGDFSLHSGPVQQPEMWAAGTCGIELRRKDAKGVQLTTLDEHALQAIVNYGWQGWVWGPTLYDPGASGTGRYGIKVPMTNPIWFASNLYLLCLKLFIADEATQASQLDIPTNLASAAICDLQVTRTVELNEGLETQWKFIGGLMDQRPLRDWLSDILLNCLGFYTFKNGKLSIGVRENAGAQVAYTNGNIIWRSLSLQPLGPQFTRLVANFADREYNYVANSATYQDDDYAVELGGGVRALHRSAQMNLSGTADISPATRFVATRAREEMGGVTAAERKAARVVTWRTSALGFDTAPGMVASITNEDMPGGFGKVRVERWKLLDDWTIELTGRTVTTSMYDLVQGPKPADVRPSDIPGVGGPVILGPVWRPNNITAIPGDPLYDTFDRTFQATQQYTVLADGSTQASLLIEGDMPVNDPPYLYPPKIGSITLVETGGHLLGGHSHFFSLCALKGLSPSPISIVAQLHIANDTNTNKITFNNIEWPAAPDGGWDGYVIFGSVDDLEVMCEQTVISTPGTALTLPTSITFLGFPSAGPPNPPNAPGPPVHFATHGWPNIAADKIRVKVKLMCHPGVSPGIVTQVVAASSTADGTIRCMHLASDRSQDTDPTEGGVEWSADPTQLALDDWSPGAGRPQRIISILTHKLDGTAPLLNFLITGYDHVSGTFSVTPDPAAANVGSGDVFVVRFTPQWNAAMDQFEDLGMVNGQYPNGTPHEIRPDGFTDRQGTQGRILMGPGRGQTRNVVYNTGTTYQFDKGFIGVDSTSLIGIEYPAWLHISDGPELDVSQFGQLGNVRVVVGDLLEHGLIVQAVIVDQTGKESADSLAPTREVFLYGDTAFGVGGLNLGFEFEFGRGGDGGPAPIAVSDISSIKAALYDGFLQGWDVVSEGVSVGDATLDILRYDPIGLAWNSILGSSVITLPSGIHDQLIFSSAFKLGINLAITTGDLIKCVVLTVGSTPPLSPVVRLYYGKPLPTALTPGS